MSLDAMIGDVHPGVILGSATPLALGAVEDVCNAKFGQLTTIRCNISAEKILAARYRIFPSLHVSTMHSHWSKLLLAGKSDFNKTVES